MSPPVSIVALSRGALTTAVLIERLSRWHARELSPLVSGQWGIVSMPDRGAPHWLAGLGGLSEVEALRSWRRCWGHIEVWGAVQVLVRVAREDQAHEAFPTGLATPSQLELAHAAPGAFRHAQLCVDCGGPVELYPGRDGRPRKACETCRPPEWPRRGERWWVDGVRVVVQGSRMVRPAPDAPRRREVRFREVETGRQCTLTGPEWRSIAVRTPPNEGEEAA